LTRRYPPPAPRDIEAMIDHVVGNKLIPAGVRKDIIERTDGIPLFVEEMTKAVLEAGKSSWLRMAATAFPRLSSAARRSRSLPIATSRCWSIAERDWRHQTNARRGLHGASATG
jgi:hypothetical protein